MIASFFLGVFVLLKKDLRLYGKNLVSTLFLLVFLAASSAAALGAALMGALGDDDSRLTMALFDKEPSSIANQAVEIVANTEGVRSMFTVEICDSEEEVRSGMESGIYDAAIIFEEGYFSKILEGDDAGVCILISDKLNSATEMVKHFALTGEKLIKIAEGGIEAAYGRLLEEYPSNTARKIITPVEIDYAFEIFAMPTEGFDEMEMPYAANGVDTFSHYILCFAAFVLVICEVIFFPYTAKDCEFSMLRRIKSYRISNAAIILQKAIIPFFIRVILLCGTFALASVFADVSLSAANILAAIAATALLSVLMTSLTVLLSQSSLGISVIFAFSVAFLVLSGGLIPSAMLPYTMMRIGEFTPLGLFSSSVAPLLCGNASYSLITLAVCTAALFAASCTYMKRITVRGGGEK